MQIGREALPDTVIGLELPREEKCRVPAKVSLDGWTFFLFVWLLLTPTNLYLIASLLLPDQDEAEPITDWEIYFFDHNREVFLLFALLFPIDLIDTALKAWNTSANRARSMPQPC